jgi:CBS domain-containing protein
MQIGKALPQIFTRTTPVLETGTQMLLAVSLLRFHQIDALPIGFKPKQKKRLAVFGYSCLKKLLETEPEDYGRFLEMPCEKASQVLSTIPATTDIKSLLRVFQKTKFGFAWVESEKLGGFASLRDLLDLYVQGLAKSDMEIGQVASPIFSLSPETEIQDVLREMFKRRIRRVFVEGRKTLVTDRRIIGYIFGTARLEATAKNPKSLLDVRLGDVDSMVPYHVKNNTKIKEAALIAGKLIEVCLVCDEGVVTPWDLVMKPLALGKLQLNT